MCPKNGGQYNLWDICGIFVGYSRSIHGVYVCIGYVSGMYRVCIGKVSKGTGREGGGIPTTDEHGLARKHGNTEIYDYNNLNNINQQHLRSQQHSER